MNSVIVNGNIGREPEITMTSGGKKLCNFSLANDKGNKEVQWVDCRAWDIKAEYLEKYVHKGYRLLVQGRLMFEIGHDQGETVPEILEAEGYTAIEVKKDYAGLDRMVFAVWPGDNKEI